MIGSIITDFFFSGTSISFCNGTNVTTNQFSLFRGHSLCIQSSNFDLTGTIITGSSPIAVVAGNINYRNNYVIVQMIPMWAWSKTYAYISPLSSGMTSYDVIVVGNSSNVVVYLNNNNLTAYSSSTSRVVRISDQTGSQMVLRANQPVMVIAYPANASTAILLPGVDSFQTSYSFALPELPTSSSDSYKYTLVVTSTGQIQNTSLFVTGTNYLAYKKNIWTSSPDGSTSSSTLDLTPGWSYYVTLIPGNTTFGAYVLYNNQQDNCSMGFPLSLGQKVRYDMIQLI